MSGEESDAGDPAGAGAGAGAASVADGSDSDRGSSSTSPRARARLPSYKVIHGYASASDSDTSPSSDNDLAVDAHALSMPPTVQKAAVRSHATRNTTTLRDLPARALYRLLQCVLALLITFLERWAPRDPGGLYWAVRGRLDKRYADDRQPQDDDLTTARILSAAASALQALPPRSRESRAIRAVLGAAGRHTLESGLAEAQALGRGRGDEDNSSGSDTSHTDTDSGEDAAPFLTRHAHRRARAHYRLLTCGSTLERKPGRRRSRSDAAVQSVVDFMYRNDNTTTLSWGSTRLKVGGKVEVIQARNRLRSLGRLWAAYDREMAGAGVGAVDRVRRTMFYELGGAITARDLKVGGRGVGHIVAQWLGVIGVFPTQNHPTPRNFEPGAPCAHGRPPGSPSQAPASPRPRAPFTNLLCTYVVGRVVGRRGEPVTPRSWSTARAPSSNSEPWSLRFWVRKTQPPQATQRRFF